MDAMQPFAAWREDRGQLRRDAQLACVGSTAAEPLPQHSRGVFDNGASSQDDQERGEKDAERGGCGDEQEHGVEAALRAMRCVVAQLQARPRIWHCDHRVAFLADFVRSLGGSLPAAVRGAGAHLIDGLWDRQTRGEPTGWKLRDGSR